MKQVREKKMLQMMYMKGRVDKSIVIRQLEEIVIEEVSDFCFYRHCKIGRLNLQKYALSAELREQKTIWQPQFVFFTPADKIVSANFHVRINEKKQTNTYFAKNQASTAEKSFMTFMVTPSFTPSIDGYVIMTFFFDSCLSGLLRLFLLSRSMIVISKWKGKKNYLL